LKYIIVLPPLLDYIIININKSTPQGVVKVSNCTQNGKVGKSAPFLHRNLGGRSVYGGKVRQVS